MADLRISDLVTASQLKNDDYYEIAQSESGTRVSYKTTLLAIAVQIATMVDFTSDLNTTSKKITGAINELKQLISLIPQFSIEVVEELPTEDISDTTIYLVPAEDPEVGNYYEEYIHVNDAWELVGTTAVDLSAYYTKLEVDGLLATKASVADVELKENKSDMPKDVRTIIKDCKTPKSATITNGIAQFECIEENLVKGLKVTMNPIQDLHGYDYPWVGGSGKNKLPTTLSVLKTKNAIGSWSGNAYTINGITFTVLTDDGDNVLGIKIQGTATIRVDFYIVGGSGGVYESMGLEATNYIMNGGNASARLYLSKNGGGTASSDGTDQSFQSLATDTYRVFIRVENGTAISTAVTLYPMIRLATVSDSTFAPYSNICPISGRTGVELEQMGKNLIVDSIASCSISSAGNLVSSTYTTYIIKTKKGARYIASANGESVASYWGEFSTAPAMGSQSISASRYSGNSLTSTIDGYIAVAFPSGSTNPMIELGQTITTYEAPITPITHTHTYASTVWWATDDFASGEMDSCGAEIASYNGETLPGGWMSDRDEYAPGTTPTIGAQVVYKNTPTTISTSAEEITTVSGTNIISGTEPISECQYTELATVDDLIKIIGGQ